MYRVLDDYNTYVEVTNEEIENWIKSNKPLKREIIMAMGFTHKKEYLQYLSLYLDDSEFYIRRDAAQSIFLIDGQAGLSQLKEREKKLDDMDFKSEPSEKALLQAMIIRIEKGTEGVEQYFFSKHGNEMVKYDLLAYYTDGYLYQEEDLELIIKILNAYTEKTIEWIQKLPKHEYKEVILFALESIYFIKESTELLKQMKDELSGQLFAIFCKIINIKLDMDAFEIIAEITEGMSKDNAEKILKQLKGKTKGDAKKAYKKALKYWNIEEG